MTSDALLGELVLDDGTQFSITVSAAGSDTGPVAVIVPALGVPAGFYSPFASRLASAAITTVTVDLRGQGASVPHPSRASRHGYAEIVEVDLPAVFEYVGHIFHTRALWAVGHSLGGQLALVAGGLSKLPISGVVLIASGSAWYGGFSGLTKLRNLAFSQLFACTAFCVGFWPGDILGFGGRQSKALMVDWAHQVRTGKYASSASSRDYEAALRGFKLPVLAVEIEGDTLAPPGAINALCKKIPAAPIKRWQYTRNMCGPDKLSHFSWARRSPGLAEYVAEWLSRKSRLSEDVGTEPDSKTEGTTPSAN